jgi:hypothetical protein
MIEILGEVFLNRLVPIISLEVVDDEAFIHMKITFQSA